MKAPISLLSATIVVATLVAGCGGGGRSDADATAAHAATADYVDSALVQTFVAGRKTPAPITSVPLSLDTPTTTTSVTEVRASPAAAAASARYASAAAAMCGTAAEVLPAGTVAAGDLVEASGLAAAWANDGVYWAHNDSGDSARAFVTNTRGSAIATYTLAGADAFDWEDMASGPGAADGDGLLYFGDIGDNARGRPEIIVYRVREPKLDRSAAPIAGTLTGVEKLTLRYPDGAHDAETLMVDPVSGDIIIVTKDGGGSQVFRAPGTLDANATTTLEQVARVDFSQLKKRAEFGDDAPPLARAGGALATSGDISPSGDPPAGGIIAIRTYSAVWLWSRAAGQSIAEALAAEPCEAASAAEPQGEAIAFDADGAGYATVSEGEHPLVHHFRSN